MGERSAVYRGDQELGRLLAEARASLSLAEVKALVAGVAAAPPGPDPAEWVELVTPRAPLALKAQLLALRETIANAADEGFDDRAALPRRLVGLRAELARRGLSGLVLPVRDEHHGEYLARRAMRVAWLTGFTGSAGVAVVLPKTAAIFVDGRYTLQAERQTDGALYERHHLTDSPPEKWIAANLKAGEKLGYDPWLHTVREVARYREACEQAAGELLACEANPLDAIWPNRPPPPLAPVVAHELAFAGLSAAEKRSRIAESLREEGVDAAVLTAPDSIAWLLNVRGGDVPCAPLPLSFAVIDASSRVDLFVDRRKLAPDLEAALGPEVRVCPVDALGAALDGLGREGKKVQSDPDMAPAWVFDRLKAAKATVVKAPDPCALPKACKNATELAGARAAHRRDGVALVRFLCWLERTVPARTVTEAEAAAHLAARRAEGAHYRGPSFETISGAGPNGAIVHYRVTPESDRRLAADELYLVDSGGQYLDGTTDVTRTVAFAPPGAEERDRFTRVLKGHIAIATARFPRGTAGAQLDPLARRALWEVGLDYDHGTGHGVGSYLGVHEGPQRISKLGGEVALAPGMIVSNEPGYYKAGAYGIRIENLVVVVERPPIPGAERPVLGFETLTRAPLDRKLIESAELTPEERAWVDGYHAEVRESLTPLLDRETAAWLADGTRPLDRD